ncbi:Predicted DNA binding protein, contains HTH domain [Natronoarchaeum philippinense]|uniref:Predicted DNA binding protein, contains HTH domain n=1 Tax=Natronoarchaeum philippinense TaxID=558529 RepID=A0A285N366_NATPI|nr:helix-turn-helix domain-containing protein [Natronoarchaeum philippinense]SNZ03870.1 Predicted DNA binding protein, contains HTH domain [Natronoarchaeum philippinense]
MTQARLSVTLPDGTWIKDVSTDHPEATFRVLAAMPGESAGFGLVRITGDDLASVLEAMGDHEVLTSVDPLEGSDDRVLVQFETTRPLLLFSARESGVPIELPMDIRDGEASMEVTASRDRLSMLGEQLDAFGLPFEVELVRERVDSERLLTDRQRELLVEAVERGYYDTPRECSVTELAEAIGCAKSTCSETLHRAEERVIKQFVGDLPDAEPEPELDVGR